MKTNDINVFLALEKYKKINLAAQALETNAASVSKQLARLEKDIDAPLFSIIDDEYVINDYGTEFLPFARQLVNLENDCINAIKNPFIQKHSLKVGYTFSLSPFNIKNFLLRFQDENTFVDTFLYTECSDVLTRQVIAGECDIAFVINCSSDSNPLLNVVPISVTYPYAIVYLSHPLAQYSELTFEQILNEKIFTAPEGSALHKLCVDEFAAFNAVPDIRLTSSNIEEISGIVSKEFGIGIATGEDLSYRTRDNVRYIKLRTSSRLTTEMIYRKDSISPSIYYFLSSISQSIQ